MKILIADDLYTNRLLVSEILRTLGHESIEAENGKQVLEELVNNSDIDLILMDIEMPVMNGLEAMKYIRSQFVHPLCSIPIIALTAHNPDMFFDDMAVEGFDSLLVKPYSIDNIAELLETYRKK